MDNAKLAEAFAILTARLTADEDQARAERQFMLDAETAFENAPEQLRHILMTLVWANRRLRAERDKAMYGPILGHWNCIKRDAHGERLPVHVYWSAVDWINEGREGVVIVDWNHSDLFGAMNCPAVIICQGERLAARVRDKMLRENATPSVLLA